MKNFRPELWRLYNEVNHLSQEIEAENRQLPLPKLNNVIRMLKYAKCGLQDAEIVLKEVDS